VQAAYAYEVQQAEFCPSQYLAPLGKSIFLLILLFTKSTHLQRMLEFSCCMILFFILLRRSLQFFCRSAVKIEEEEDIREPSFHFTDLQHETSNKNFFIGLFLLTSTTLQRPFISYQVSIFVYFV